MTSVSNCTQKSVKKFGYLYMELVAHVQISYSFVALWSIGNGPHCACTNHQNFPLIGIGPGFACHFTQMFGKLHFGHLATRYEIVISWRSECLSEKKANNWQDVNPQPIGYKESAFPPVLGYDHCHLQSTRHSKPNLAIYYSLLLNLMAFF